jgi:hypothetical protein
MNERWKKKMGKEKEKLTRKTVERKECELFLVHIFLPERSNTRTLSFSVFHIYVNGNAAHK